MFFPSIFLPLSLFGRVSFHSPLAYHLLASVRLPLPHSYIFTFRKDVTRYRKRKSPAATMREWAAAAAAVRGYTPKIHSRNTLPVRGNFFQLSFLSSQPASGGARRAQRCVPPVLYKTTTKRRRLCHGRRSLLRSLLVGHLQFRQGVRSS